MSGHTGAVPGTARPRRRSVPYSGVGVASPPEQSGFMPSSPAWPLVSYVELGALPTAVSCARWHAKALLAEWGLAQAEELAEVTELLLSELMTNAYETTAARGLHTPVRFRLSSNHDRVLIEVWDGDATAPPAPSTEPLSPMAEAGRGLLLVNTLSSRWSWYALRTAPGKVVWAEVVL